MLEVLITRPSTSSLPRSPFGTVEAGTLAFPQGEFVIGSGDALEETGFFKEPLGVGSVGAVAVHIKESLQELHSPMCMRQVVQPQSGWVHLA